MSESNDAASPDKPVAPKSNKLVIILALVNTLGVLGLGGYMFYTQQQAAAQAHKPAASGGKAAEHGNGADAEGHAPEGEAQAGEHGASAEGHGAGGSETKEVRASLHDDEPAGKGPLLALEPMVTNLGEPDSDRYLKATMQLRLTSEAARAEVESQLVPVRNQILLYLSSLTMSDLLGAEKKRDLQKRVKRIANESMPSSRITQVYFTEFVIQ